MRFTVFLVLLGYFVDQAFSSGHVEIRLKSAHPQKATVTLSDDVDPGHLVLPVVLPKNEEMKFGEFLLNFNKTYRVTIELDGTDSLGLKESVYRGTIDPVRGSVSPMKLNLPLIGVRFDFECDPNWYGAKCDLYCLENCTSSEMTKTWDNETEFVVNYTVNTEKLDSIVEMLRKENEISNSFTKSTDPVPRGFAKFADSGKAEEQENVLKDIMEGSGEIEKV